MKKITSSLIILFLAMCSSMFAFAAHTPPQSKTVVIPDGTEISAVTIETISSKTAHEDDPIQFQVDEDIVIDGVIVIAKGTLVKGVVSNAKKSGFFGRGGELNVRIESTETVDKQKLKLRAAKGKAGDNKTGTTVALVVLFGPLGFLKKGKNAEIAKGTHIKVFTDEAKSVVIPTP
ncbi:MAG: hypothetical protein ABIP78_11500 [Pyrinomonadaceae bacterium]